MTPIRNTSFTILHKDVHKIYSAVYLCLSSTVIACGEKLVFVYTQSIWIVTL